MLTELRHALPAVRALVEPLKERLTLAPGDTNPMALFS